MMHAIPWVRTGCLVVLLSLAGTHHPSAASSLAIAAGKGSENLDAVRLAWQEEWDWQRSVGEDGVLSGFHALSVNHWWNESESVSALGYSPIFTYQRTGSPWYIKGGIGVAYLSDTQIAGRILSTRFQFEDQIGIGWQNGKYDLSLVYRHYSNAGLDKPNHGIDLLLLSCVWRLD